MLNRVKRVHTVSCTNLCFAELQVFFKAQVAGIELAVVRAEQGGKSRRSCFKAKAHGVMLVIASQESALGNVRIDVGTKVTCNRPVGTESAELCVEFSKSQIPLVVGVVGIGANLVVARGLAVAILDLVAECRRKDSQGNHSVKTFRRIFAANICTQE